MPQISLDQDDLGDPYVVTAVFPSQYKGYCKINLSHRIKLGQMVGKLAHADNPFLPVSGVACEKCLRDLARAPRE
jgi:hypothetical protein